MKIITRQEALEKDLKRYYTGKPCKRGHIDFRAKANGDCFQCTKEKREKNKDKISIRRKEHYYKNRESILEKARIYGKENRKNNPEKCRIRDKEYRQKIKEKDPDYYKKLYIKNKKETNEKCKKHYHENKEYHKNKNKKWRKDNPDRLKYIKKRWRIENRDKEVLTKKQWRLKNKDKIKEQARLWLENNRDKDNLRSSRRRLRVLERSFMGFEDDILEFYTEAHFLNEKTGIRHHVDHIIPLVGKVIDENGEWVDFVSGLHVPWNLQVITEKENLDKGCFIRDISKLYD